MDQVFDDPRLVAIYDALERDRSDLEVYTALIDELGARHIVDLGCGTGTFALLLAARGLTVTAVDPAAGSLDHARTRPGADRVTWILGDARHLPALDADLAIMTGNVAQAIVTDEDWSATLAGLHTVLRPGGRLVFETRDPAYRGWTHWTRAATQRTTTIDGIGEVESWTEITSTALPLVSFRETFAFASDDAVVTSRSTLRFRDRDELETDLTAHGYLIDDIRDAPDRPGRELVVLAHRAPLTFEPTAGSSHPVTTG